MRHRVYGKHLGRNKDERDNLFRGLVQAIFTYGTIQTSETKAKAIKSIIDKVVNLAKNKQRQYRLASFISDKNLQDRLISEIAPKLSNRTSGYTSVVRMGTRLGDQTTVVKMSIIGAEQLQPFVKESRVKSLESSKKVEKPQEKEEKKAIRVNESKETTKSIKSRRGAKQS